MDLDVKGFDLGRIKYNSALKLQEEAQKIVENNPRKGFVFFLEHSPVVTMGKNFDSSHLLISKEQLIERGVDYVETDRGGQVTAHMPGQLVVYPILNLGRNSVGAKSYVCHLEQSVIDFLAEFGVSAARDDSHPGVWVGKNKICAIGIRISRRVSLHGLAINLNNSLELFEYMNPCGIFGRGVTNLCSELKTNIDISEAKISLAKILGSALFKKELAIQLLDKNMLQ